MIKQDRDLLRSLIKESPSWQRVECGMNDLEVYLRSYEMFQGSWRVWNSPNNEPIGISYHLDWAPSNERPWLGTILIHPNERNKGYGKRIIQQIGQEQRENGHKALYASSPAIYDDWLKFLGKCQFEQVKLETNNTNNLDYIICVKPL